MTSAPETFMFDGASSTLRALIFPSSTYADHLYKRKVKKKRHYLSKWNYEVKSKQTIHVLIE